MYSFESHIIYKPFPDIMCYNGRFILCPPTDFTSSYFVDHSIAYRSMRAYCDKVKMEIEN